ncbi:hypothetical protein EVAR_103605_1 [Eumeta japonica]|uniref:Uncharacterized protein n=1 Tax=Eumeta variegata TaxID=151549 RepID=A0A4C1Z774_EUMVA|nr:hypothetical protein EVAR_103605_1 [Eumeta japonica]
MGNYGTLHGAWPDTDLVSVGVKVAAPVVESIAMSVGARRRSSPAVCCAPCLYGYRPDYRHDRWTVDINHVRFFIDRGGIRRKSRNKGSSSIRSKYTCSRRYCSVMHDAADTYRMINYTGSSLCATFSPSSRTRWSFAVDRAAFQSIAKLERSRSRPLYLYIALAVALMPRSSSVRYHNRGERFTCPPATLVTFHLRVVGAGVPLLSRAVNVAATIHGELLEKVGSGSIPDSRTADRGVYCCDLRRRERVT